MRPFLRLMLLALVAVALLAGCASTPPGTAGIGEPRSITLHHPASGETLAVTYRGPDGYDGEALQRISLLFRDRRTDVAAPVDPLLVDLLADLRDRCGVSPDTPIQLTSGYRSKATNVALARRNANVADASYHLRGQAADIAIPGVDPRRLAAEAEALGRGGYALYPHSGHVHVDTGPVRTWTPKDLGRPATIEARKAPGGKPDGGRPADRRTRTVLALMQQGRAAR